MRVAQDLEVQTNVEYNQAPNKSNANQSPRFTRFITSMSEQFRSLCWNVGFIVSVIVLSSLPLATIIVGGVRRFECPFDSRMPIWLIVFGVVGITGCLFVNTMMIIRYMCINTSKLAMTRFIVSIIGIILFLLIIWSVVGASWILKKGTQYQSNNSTADNYCDASIHKLSLGLIVIGVIPFIIIATCVYCFCCRRD
ncbi:unnamed protein product [Adineta steineri]|uniref:Uncharacterized protein n=1 Tax=Adineta steineri TaxID=433720 RepID=A0A814VN57_9BILA|nr:unnamed protein product [Adineta steineri]CAF1190583.1 unnamed protein product [Adineta steineri]CAF1464191.1 unnamed protein product [Adineta steineri]CAF1634039.1 unnamed protein product [Adineta steineri]